MSAFLEAIHQRILDADIGTEPDYDEITPFGVYIERMPKEATHGTLITQRPEGSRVDHTSFGYLRTRIRVTCRGTQYAEVHERMHAVMRAMELTACPETIEGVLFFELRAETAPATSPLSEGGLIESSIVVRVAYGSDYTYEGDVCC